MRGISTLELEGAFNKALSSNWPERTKAVLGIRDDVVPFSSMVSLRTLFAHAYIIGVYDGRQSRRRKARRAKR